MYFWTPLRRLPHNVEGVAIFSPAHLLWLSCVILFLMGTAIWFQRAGKRSRERFLRLAAHVMPLSELLRMLLLAVTGGFSPADSLPLHLCGVMIFVEFAAVFRRNPFLTELCWSLGLPGALCALITPGETDYPFWNIYYLQFILVHTLLLLIPLLLFMDGFCPAIRRLPGCFLFLLGLATVDAAANALFGGNYLFLSAAPPGSLLAVIAHLAGPLYLPVTACLVWLIWGGYYGGFLLLRKRLHKTVSTVSGKSSGALLP